MSELLVTKSNSKKEVIDCKPSLNVKAALESFGKQRSQENLRKADHSPSVEHIKNKPSVGKLLGAFEQKTKELKEQVDKDHEIRRNPKAFKGDKRAPKPAAAEPSPQTTPSAEPQEPAPAPPAEE